MITKITPIRIGTCPRAFFYDHAIQNGQIVVLSYLEDISLNNGLHVLQSTLYRFKWRDEESYKFYKENVIARGEQNIRAKHGFATYDPVNAFDPDDWHSRTYVPDSGARKGKYTYRHGGPGIYPLVYKEYENDESAEDEWEPIGKLKPPSFFMCHGSISIKQIITKSEIIDTQCYLVKDDDLHEISNEEKDNILESSVPVSSNIDSLSEEERAYVAEMDAYQKKTECKRISWDKVFWILGEKNGSLREQYGKRCYDPFLWLNDDVLKAEYSYLSPQLISYLFRTQHHRYKKYYNQLLEDACKS